MSKSSAQSCVPLLVNQLNLSAAWAEAVLHVLDHPGKEIAPLILSITGFLDEGVAPENDPVRRQLDTMLVAKGNFDVEDVAYTIFPQRLWRMSGGDRHRLFALYRVAFPRYRAMNRQLNGRGLYFERLVSFGRGPCDGNQLEWILSQYQSRDDVRRSMFQASVFDPGRDHVASAQLGFPCMQHVSFEPTGAGLVVNAFYATQQLFVKAYGNYLGLARLGAFMAHEMGLPLARLNVMVGVAKLERVTKTEPALAPLVSACRNLLKEIKAGNDQSTAASRLSPPVTA